MPQELVGSHAVRDLLPPANQRTQLAQAMSQERQAENLSRRVPLARSTPPCRCGRFDGTTYGAMPDSWQAGSKSPWNSAIHRRSGGPHRKRATRPQRVQEVRRAGAGHAAVGLPHARARGRIPSREVIDRVPVSPHGARRPQGWPPQPARRRSPDAPTSTPEPSTNPGSRPPCRPRWSILPGAAAPRYALPQAGTLARRPRTASAWHMSRCRRRVCRGRVATTGRPCSSRRRSKRSRIRNRRAASGSSQILSAIRADRTM